MCSECICIVDGVPTKLRHGHYTLLYKVHLWWSICSISDRTHACNSILSQASSIRTQNLTPAQVFTNGGDYTSDGDSTTQKNNMGDNMTQPHWMFGLSPPGSPLHYVGNNCGDSTLRPNCKNAFSSLTLRTLEYYFSEIADCLPRGPCLYQNTWKT